MNGTDNAIYLRRVTQYWAADSVNWDNQPSDTIMNQVILPTSISDSQNYFGINVTLLVQDMVTYGNYGFKASPIDTLPDNSMIFRNTAYTDSNYRPQLTIVYTTVNVNVNIGADQTVYARQLYYF